MNWGKATTIFIVLIALTIAAYDVLAIVKGGVETSISHTMIAWAYHYPIFPFFMGVVVGHLFWRMSDTPITKRISNFVQNKDVSNDSGNGAG